MNYTPSYDFTGTNKYSVNSYGDYGGFKKEESGFKK